MLTEAFCKNCRKEFLVDSSLLKFPGCVKPSGYIEDVLCKDCKKKLDK